MLAWKRQHFNVYKLIQLTTKQNLFCSPYNKQDNYKIEQETNHEWLKYKIVLVTPMQMLLHPSIIITVVPEKYSCHSQAHQLFMLLTWGPTYKTV